MWEEIVLTQIQQRTAEDAKKIAPPVQDWGATTQLILTIDEFLILLSDSFFTEIGTTKSVVSAG